MTREKLAWLFVIVWVMLIFASIPTARGIQAFVAATCGRQFFTIAVFSVLAAFGALALRHIKQQSKRLASLVWLCLLVGIYAVWTYRLRGNPEESVHFVEYGVLSALLFTALSFRIRNSLVYVLAFLIASIVGGLDEAVQRITPNRVFDYRDIGFNAAAVLLAQIAIATVVRPSFISKQPV